MCSRGLVASLGDRLGCRDLERNIPNYEVNASIRGGTYGLLLTHRVYTNVALGNCLTDLLVTGATRRIICGAPAAPLLSERGVETLLAHPIATGTRPGLGAISA